jgi:hypothetical protein
MSILEQREEKIKLLIERGYTADIENGIIYNKNGKEVKTKDNGYLRVGTTFNKKQITVKQHQFIYYLSTGKVVDMIDHKDGDGTNNRIDNLRKSNSLHNQQNQVKAKGYTWNKNSKKWKAQININGKKIGLGYYDNKEASRQAYLDAKKLYHTAVV